MVAQHFLVTVAKLITETLICLPDGLALSLYDWHLGT